jgi:hypothetical protein
LLRLPFGFVGEQLPSFLLRGGSLSFLPLALLLIPIRRRRSERLRYRRRRFFRLWDSPFADDTADPAEQPLLELVSHELAYG